jgi:hypothetical protein
MRFTTTVHIYVARQMPTENWRHFSGEASLGTSGFLLREE